MRIAVKLSLITVGRLKDGPEQKLAGRYLERSEALGRGLGFSGPKIVELAESRARRDQARMIEEGAAIRLRLAGVPALVLTENGASPTSEAFADGLRQRRDAGSPALAFVIGGPDGLDPGLLPVAAGTLSFGRLTLPHQLVRVLLLEQIYRAFTIIAGHPYHRAGAGVS